MIGSGFGGLALAIRLQSAGFQTTIFEARDKPGGRAYVYEDQGFTFDAGPTVITDPDCLRELFALTGRRLEDYVDLIPVRPFYRLCWEDGYVFDYSNDVEENNRQIQEKNPEDVDGYRRFLVYDVAGTLIFLLVFGGLGYAFGPQWQIMGQSLGQYMGCVLGLAVAAIVLYLLLRRLWLRRRPQPAVPYARPKRLAGRVGRS